MAGIASGRSLSTPFQYWRVFETFTAGWFSHETPNTSIKAGIHSFAGQLRPATSNRRIPSRHDTILQYACRKPWDTLCLQWWIVDPCLRHFATIILAKFLMLAILCASEIENIELGHLHHIHSCVWKHCQTQDAIMRGSGIFRCRDLGKANGRSIQTLPGFLPDPQNTSFSASIPPQDGDHVAASIHFQFWSELS